MKKEIKERLLAFFKDSYREDYDELEIIYLEDYNILSRFSDNNVIQNLSQKRGEVRFRVIKDKKTFVSSTDDLSKENLLKTFNQAKENLEFIPKNDELLPLYRDNNIISITQEHTPISHRDKAISIKKALDYVESENMKAAGIHQEISNRIVLLNSNGLEKESLLLSANFSISITAPTKGWSQQITEDANSLDTLKVAKEAVEIAKMNQNSISVEAGKYDVVLSPEAVADLISFLSYYGFNGKEFYEKTGPFSELNKQVIDKRVNITDNYNHKLKKGIPFDFEGVDKKVLPLIESGVLKNIPLDLKYANKLNLESTGHGLEQPNNWGTLPLNMVLSGGGSTKEKLIKSTKRGLYVNRFHYTNIINPKDTTITGMTRDGLFLIEDGKITKSVKNLRFTESILEALNRIDDFSEELFVANEFFNSAEAIIVPFMKIKDFNFSSTTEF